MSNLELKKICVNIFERAFGVRPKIKDIELLECLRNGKSICFQIAGNLKAYDYTSNIVEEKLDIYPNASFWDNPIMKIALAKIEK